MKNHTLWNPLLALIGTVSSLFCLLSGLMLHIQKPVPVIFIWALTALTANWKPLSGLCLSLVWIRDWGRILPVFRFLGCMLLWAWGLSSAPPLPESVDSAAGLWGCLLLVLLCTALGRRKRIAGAVLTMLLPALLCLLLPDTEPDSLPLFCLLASVLLLLLTDSVRLESTTQALRLLKLAALPVLLSLSLLFLSFPSRTYVNRSDLLLSRLSQLLGRKLDIPVWIMKTDDGINLEQLSGGKDTPILEVTSSCTGSVYLRMQDYREYTGKSWQNSTSRLETLSGTGVPLEQLQVKTFRTLPLLLPCWPGSETELRNGAVPNPEQRTEYCLERYAPAPASRPDEQYLALPETTRSGLKTILDALDLSEDIPAAIQRYVRQAAPYDRNPAPLPPEAEDFALWFLENAETGCCVHYATAAVLLLRAAGIPARLVTGFLAETQAGSPVTVTEGHAWAEYYADSCWHLLDATPAAPVPAEPQPDAQMRLPSPMAVLILVPFLPLQRWLRLLFRRWNQHHGRPNRRALTRFREAALLSRRLHIPLPQNLIDIAEKAQYSQHSVTPQELAAFSAFRRDCRKAKISLPKRLWERYVYCI